MSGGEVSGRIKLRSNPEKIQGGRDTLPPAIGSMSSYTSEEHKEEPEPLRYSRAVTGTQVRTEQCVIYVISVSHRISSNCSSSPAARYPRKI